MGKGQSEARSTDGGIGAELDPEDVANERRVVGREGVPAEPANQSARRVALADLQEVVVAARTLLQLERTGRGREEI